MSEPIRHITVEQLSRFPLRCRVTMSSDRLDAPGRYRPLRASSSSVLAALEAAGFGRFLPAEVQTVVIAPGIVEVTVGVSEEAS
jgi:hypothetical protein